MRPRHVLVLALGLLAPACAAPLQPTTTTPGSLGGAVRPAPRNVTGSRPSIGVAFGGGSARGLAHVGVLRWFDEHRIPVDLAAGTSMGGLIGGAFAAGMDADDIQAMLDTTDWDAMFGASTFQYKNVRRKEDARAYPSRFEFGLRRGIVPPPSLNNGQQVELLLARITAPSFDVESFDDLPTPFRCVAVDLVSASQVVLDRGSLASALRATMSLPLIFPPVELDGHVLVDGGAMNNVPADVVKAMGADVVLAINVGDLSDREGIAYTLTGVAGATLDAMMRASTRDTLQSADVVINVPLEGYGSLDWRRSTDLIRDGYQAAETMRDRLLPLAVSEQEYSEWLRERAGRRRRALPVPTFVRVEGFAAADASRLAAQFASYVNSPLDVSVLEQRLSELIGLDRYETVTWRLVRDAGGAAGLLVVARPKPFAPPFLMLGLNLENTTSSDFQITAAARFLTYGVLTSGSEVRIDGTLGSNPAVGVELYQPVVSAPFFVAPSGSVVNRTERSIVDDTIVARYGVTTSRLTLDGGANLWRTSDVRVGAYWAHVDAAIEVGDPGLPELRGQERGAILRWRADGQDSPVVPSRGLATAVRLQRIFEAPDGVVEGRTVALDGRVTQFEARSTQFWSLGARNRTFLGGGIGMSFDGTALPTNEYTVGGPLRLGAYAPGELRGQHYYSVTGGYLRQVGRLPDFVGGPVFAGAWADQSDAFDDWGEAAHRVNPGLGIVMDTLLGPVMLAGSAGFDGRWRVYVGVGRIFR